MNIHSAYQHCPMASKGEGEPVEEGEGERRFEERRGELRRGDARRAHGD